MAEQYLARLSMFLKSFRQVDTISNGGIVTPLRNADIPDHSLADRDTDTKAELGICLTMLLKLSHYRRFQGSEQYISRLFRATTHDKQGQDSSIAASLAATHGTA